MVTPANGTSLNGAWSRREQPVCLPRPWNRGNDGHHDHCSDTDSAELTRSLNQVLADSYALLSLTHMAHWNVEGPGFFALHTAFQTQYEELFVAIDEIAERIRALDAYAIGGLGTLAQAAQMKEFASPLAQEDYVRALIAANEKLLGDAARAREVAGLANDAESQDLMIGRITLHQKTIWMLKSSLKG